MNRRAFLALFGIVGSVAVTYGARPVPSPEATEDVQFRVYGPERTRLATHVVPVTFKLVDGRGHFYGPPDLSVVLTGPVTVSALALETPRDLRRLRPEIPLPTPGLPVTVRTGETVTVLLPRPLMVYT